MAEVMAMSTEMSGLLQRISGLSQEEQRSILNMLRDRLGGATAESSKRTSEERLAALEAAFGAWTDENHPDLKTVEDIHRWLDDIRRPVEERLTGRPQAE
ncbi:MAG: hypothetical protein AB1700_19875 [Bacillota bacterium]